MVLGGAKIGKYGLAEGFTFTSFKIATQLLPLYNLSINVYVFAIKIAALWNAKAKNWLNGRRNWREVLSQKIKTGDRIIWMHCASAGEFEQGKPLIEKLKALYPNHKLLVSFFSPSGLETAGNYSYTDIVTYLPMDTANNAKEFVAIVKPELAIFVKYDFWYHHFSALAFKQIPLLLVSAVFRKDQMFFKPWGKFYKQMLFLFRHIFVQDKASMEILKLHGVDHCSVSGDTRFDRVLKIAGAASLPASLKQFAGNMPLIVAGSTWPDDEKMLQQLNGFKLIIAPHEVNETHLMQIEKLFPTTVRFSNIHNVATNTNVLLIDNVGMLSQLYSVADICYVGGGFTKDGIHNILEAAVYGKPVVFGPNYKKYREAKEMIAAGGALSFSTCNQLQNIVNKLMNNKDLLKTTGENAEKFVRSNAGATQKIVAFIQENRLLTRV